MFDVQMHQDENGDPGEHNRGNISKLLAARPTFQKPTLKLWEVHKESMPYSGIKRTEQLFSRLNVQDHELTSPMIAADMEYEEAFKDNA